MNCLPNSDQIKKLTHDQLLFIYLNKRVELNYIHTNYVMPTVEFLIQFIPFANEAVIEWKKIKETSPEFNISDILGEDNDSEPTSYVKDKEKNPYDKDYYSIQVGNMKIVKSPFQSNEEGKVVYKDIKLDPQKLIDAYDWSINGNEE